MKKNILNELIDVTKSLSMEESIEIETFKYRNFFNIGGISEREFVF